MADLWKRTGSIFHKNLDAALGFTINICAARILTGACVYVYEAGGLKQAILSKTRWYKSSDVLGWWVLCMDGVWLIAVSGVRKDFLQGSSQQITLDLFFLLYNLALRSLADAFVLREILSKCSCHGTRQHRFGRGIKVGSSPCQLSSPYHRNGEFSFKIVPCLLLS